MTNKVRWGILSTANIAQEQFIPAIIRADNAEVVAIASRGIKAYDVAAKLNIRKAYTSYEQLLEDEEVDAVYIPLPNHLHLEWVRKAAKKSKHILCEKPAALTSEEAIQMVEVTKENNVKFMEAFMYQFHLQHKRVQDIIKSGEIGAVKLMKSSHSFYLGNRENDIRMDKEMGGGSLYDVGCYSIHLIRNVLQMEPVGVQAQAVLDRKTKIDLSSTCYLKFENGVRAVIDCSFEMAERNEYEIVGTKGTIKVPHAFRPDRNGGIGQIIVQSNGFTREERVQGDIYKLEVEFFSKSIIENENLSDYNESTIANMKVIEACYQSIQTGQYVKLNG